MQRTNGTMLLVGLLLVGCGGGGGDEVMETATEETAPAPPAPMPDEDVRVVLALDRVFQDAVRTGQWELLRDIYEPDAVHLPPGYDAVEGIDAIVRHYAEVNPDSGLAGFNTDTEVIQGDASIGYHRGTWTAGSGRNAVRGKFMWIMRRTPDGEWRIVADMFNTSG